MGMPRVPKGLKSSMPGIKQYIKSEWELGVLQSRSAKQLLLARHNLPFNWARIRHARQLTDTAAYHIYNAMVADGIVKSLPVTTPTTPIITPAPTPTTPVSPTKIPTTLTCYDRLAKVGEPVLLSAMLTDNNGDAIRDAWIHFSVPALKQSPDSKTNDKGLAEILVVFPDTGIFRYKAVFYSTGTTNGSECEGTITVSAEEPVEKPVELPVAIPAVTIEFPIDHPLADYVPREVASYYPRKIGDKTDIEILETAISRGLNILLISDTGSGKSHALEFIANRLKMPYFRANLNGGTTTDDMIGQWVPKETGGFEWIDGSLVKFVKFGGIYCADELNFAKPDILAFLNPLLDFGRFIVVFQHKGERIKAHPQFVFVAAMNPPGAYIGTRPLNLALQDRFQVVLDFKVTTQLLEKLVPNPKLREFKTKIDDMISKGEIKGTLSVRGMQQYMQNAELFGKEVATKILLQKFSGAGLDAVEHMIDIVLWQ